MPKTEPPDEFRPHENPAAWFVELLLADDRGDFGQVVSAQRELVRLGWLVAKVEPRGRKGGER